MGNSRGNCVVFNAYWPWLISSSLFGHDSLQIRLQYNTSRCVHSEVSGVLGRYFSDMTQMITSTWVCLVWRSFLPWPTLARSWGLNSFKNSTKSCHTVPVMFHVTVLGAFCPWSLSKVWYIMFISTPISLLRIWQAMTLWDLFLFLAEDCWHIWGLWCQNQASQAGISNYIPKFTVGYNS